MIDEKTPINDLMAQCSKKLIKMPEEEENKRIWEIANCNHLFVKIKESQDNLDEDTTIIECVYCGVTNKYRILENTLLKKIPKSLEYYIMTKYHCKDVEYRESTIETEMMDKLERSGKELPLMSDEVIRTNHPNVLYTLARRLHPGATNEELFQIMKELNKLENSSEKQRLNTIDDAMELVLRYKEKKKELIKR